MDFKNYGGVIPESEFEQGAGQEFNEVSGGEMKHVDPYGNEESKEKDALDMNAGEAFNKDDYTKIEAMGSDYPCKPGEPGQFKDNKGDHFKVGDVDPYGTYAGKSDSYHDTKRK